MQNIWLNKKNNKNLIVFFSGWGSDEKLFQHLNPENFDVIMFYDYTKIEEISYDFSIYEKKYLICWSMGCLVCNLFYDTFKNFDKRIAINGTQKPIDDIFGIPVKIYDLTVNNFNDLSCKKFMSKISQNEIFKNYSPRSTEDLKAELISLKNLTPNNLLKFDKAIISTKDRIIPPQNQINWWTSQNTPIEKIETFHYIFDLYNKWSELQ